MFIDLQQAVVEYPACEMALLFYRPLALAAATRAGTRPGGQSVPASMVVTVGQLNWGDSRLGMEPREERADVHYRLTREYLQLRLYTKLAEAAAAVRYRKSGYRFTKRAR
eukprot:IDg2253t1